MGNWTGTFQSSLNPSLSGPVSLAITDQDKHRFVGTFLVPPTPVTPTEPCRGTVSASGEITIVVGSNAAVAVAHGTVTGNVMMLDYEIQGGTDKGSMIVSQRHDF